MCLPTENADYLLINELSSKFGHMLSIGAIHFKDRFCTSRQGGTGGCGWVYRSG